MTKEQRKDQIQGRIALGIFVILDIVGLVLFIYKCEQVLADEISSPPVAGFAAAVIEMESSDFEIADIDVVEISTEPMFCEQAEDTSDYILVSSTAYYDINGYGYGSGVRPLINNYTIAGKVEWLDKDVTLYRVNADGTVGSLIGYYHFADTGYGTSTGYGESKILKGRCIGTIENGTCIDLYFDTYSKCVNWGRRNVYIKFN